MARRTDEGPPKGRRLDKMGLFFCSVVGAIAITMIRPDALQQLIGLTGRTGDNLDLPAAGRRLSTSTKCRKALEAMLNNPHWQFMNQSYTKWCRIKAENEMARCCSIADFAIGRGEGCEMARLSGEPVETECATTCWHTNMVKLCEESLTGVACTVDRKLFDKAPLRVTETMCVPDDCNNDSDRDAFIAWFSTLYANRLSGWHENWDDAVLSCPSVAVQALLWTLLGIFIVVLLLPVLYILFVAPKEKGRTLVSQAEMQAQADADGEFVQDLRGSATGEGPMGQTGMSAG